MRRFIAGISILFALSFSAKADVDIPQDLSFKAAHPRLMISNEDFSQNPDSQPYCFSGAGCQAEICSIHIHSTCR